MTEDYSIITNIIDHGTVVQVLVDPLDSIVFDHRMFQHMYDARGGVSIGDLIRIDYDDDGNPVVELG